MSVCAKTISLWLQKDLSMAERHMSLGTHWGTVETIALVAGVSLVSILQEGDMARVFSPTRHYFITYIIAAYRNKDPGQYAVLGLSE